MAKLRTFVGEQTRNYHRRIDGRLTILVGNDRLYRLDLSRADILAIELFPDLDDQVVLCARLPHTKGKRETVEKPKPLLFTLSLFRFLTLARLRSDLSGRRRWRPCRRTPEPCHAQAPYRRYNQFLWHENRGR